MSSTESTEPTLGSVYGEPKHWHSGGVTNAIDPAERFIAQPFVCGAMGADSRGLFPRLLEAAPTRTKLLHSAATVRFAASASTGLEQVRGGWVWGRYIARNSPAKDADNAAGELGLAGLWHDQDGATLHSDWLGLHDIFVRTVGDTTYWANRLTPLVGLVDDLLHPDAEAWRTCLMLSGFSDEQTPFVEIKRLGVGQRLRREGGRTEVRSSLPGWFTNPDGCATVDDLIEALEAAVPRSLWTRSDLTLSGGLDSRLILATMRSRGGRKPRTWSTFHESGWDGDERIAGVVARVARTRHRLVEYSPNEWLASREETFKRLEHSTSMHNWLRPLAQVLRAPSGRAPVLDGLGGDVLMRYHDAVPRADREERTLSVWRSLGGDHFATSRVLGQQTRDKWSQERYGAWRQAMRQWEDHPYAESVMRMVTRTRRAVAASPFRLFAPERKVLTPLMDPVVVRTAFAVPPLPADDRDLRVRALHRLDPNFASIPSTVDAFENRRAFSERGVSSREAAVRMVEAIRSREAIADLFDPDALNELIMRPDGGFIPTPVRNASMMAHWVATWRSRLVASFRFDDAG